MRRIMLGFALAFITSCGSPQPATSQTVTTSQGEFTVPGMAYIDGRDPNASPPGTLMSIRIWDSAARTRPVCSIPHGARVSTLDATQSEGRYYFEVSQGACRGWVSEPFVATQEYPPVGDQIR